MLSQLTTCIELRVAFERIHQLTTLKFTFDRGQKRKRLGDSDIIDRVLAIRFPRVQPPQQLCNRDESLRFVSRVQKATKPARTMVLDHTRAPCLEFEYEGYVLFRFEFGSNHVHMYTLGVGPNNEKIDALWPELFSLGEQDEAHDVLEALAMVPQEFLQMTSWHPIGPCRC